MSETETCGQPKIGNFSWNELVTPDPKAAEAFYKQLFGWQSRPFTPPGTPPGAPSYTMFFTEANAMGTGGMMACPAPGMPAQWHAYVIVKDVDASLALATKLGAQVCLPAMDVPEVGRVAMIQDPQGATLGLHQPPG